MPGVQPDLDRLCKVLKENKVIPVHQTAYQKLHSTDTALYKIYDGLIISTGQDQTSLLFLLDLSAAFDIVDHRILIGKLFYCGILDSALAFLMPYLEHCHQQIVIGSLMSESSLLYCGVPQGSLLGPILFIV